MKKVFTILMLVSLASCAKFSIKHDYNEFRDIDQCKMENNTIDVKIKKLSSRLDFNFAATKTPLLKTYILTIESNEGISFKNDSNLIFNLTFNNKDFKQLKLQAFKADNLLNTNARSMPTSSFIQGIYYPNNVYTDVNFHSYVEYFITKDNMQHIVNADNIKFKLESLEGNTIEGEFSA